MAGLTITRRVTESFFVGSAFCTIDGINYGRIAVRVREHKSTPSKSRMISIGDSFPVGSGTVTILEVKGGQARINIVAPKHVSIDREEIRKKRDRDGSAHIHQPAA